MTIPKVVNFRNRSVNSGRVSNFFGWVYPGVAKKFSVSPPDGTGVPNWTLAGIRSIYRLLTRNTQTRTAPACAPRSTACSASRWAQFLILEPPELPIRNGKCLVLEDTTVSKPTNSSNCLYGSASPPSRDLRSSRMLCCVLVVSYRRFGTTCRSHLQGSSSHPSATSHNSDLMFTAAEASNRDQGPPWEANSISAIQEILYI